MIQKFLKIGSQPITIVYPIPLASFLGFCLTERNVMSFISSYVFAFFFFVAINLWNHINDAEDDIKAGRTYSEFLIQKKREAIIFVIFCYFASMIVLLRQSQDTGIALTAFCICAVFTWLYSDRMFIGKFIRRFKEDYRTEIITYIVSTFSFFILFWTFFSKSSIKGIYFTLILSIIYISGSILKDIKDFTEDSEAGYRTLAIVLSPSTLLRISILILLALSNLIIVAYLYKIFPGNSIFSLSYLLPVIYSAYKFHKNKWQISNNVKNILKLYTASYPITIILLSFFSLI
jgi:1,4-dihydroxy-2-naphthoate octaprenyltransferase